MIMTFADFYNAMMNNMMPVVSWVLIGAAVFNAIFALNAVINCDDVKHHRYMSLGLLYFIAAKMVVS